MRSRWAVIWAIVLILGGLFLLAQNLGLLGVLRPPIWSVLFAALGVLFLLNFITAPAQWWSLIPGCILIGLGLTVFLAQAEAPGDWLGSLFLFSVGLPFLLIYLIQMLRGYKGFWWALIPGGIFLAQAFFVLAATRLPGEVVGALVMGVIGAPFLVVFGLNWRKNWWAFIPGGVLLDIGVLLLLTMMRLPGDVVVGLFFLGLAAVFGVLYALSVLIHETRWAIYPAAGALALGVFMMAWGRGWWPVVLIVVGLYLLVRALWPDRRR